MKKKMLVFFLAACLIATLSLGISAADMPRLIDGAYLLTETESAAIQEKLDETSDTYKMDVVIVTVDSIEGWDSEGYADAILDEYNFGYGDDAILFLISMEYRDWAISTTGKCIDVFDDYALDSIEENAVSHLSAGDYYGAFSAFIEECAYYMDGAINGFPFDFGMALIISAVVGVVAALIIVGTMKGKLKSVRQRNEAGEYLKPGSFNVTQSNDLFLYHTVTRTPRPKSNSSGSGTHTSSAGRTHGGRSGKF